MYVSMLFLFMLLTTYTVYIVFVITPSLIAVLLVIHIGVLSNLCLQYFRCYKYNSVYSKLSITTLCHKYSKAIIPRRHQLYPLLFNWLLRPITLRFS